jgi:acyl carrier protein
MSETDNLTANDLNPVGERVIKVIQRLLPERSTGRPVSSDDNLVEVGLTSLDIVKLVLLVEDEFDLMIPLNEIIPANFRSICSISRLVTKLLNSA